MILSPIVCLAFKAESVSLTVIALMDNITTTNNVFIVILNVLNVKQELHAYHVQEIELTQDFAIVHKVISILILMVIVNNVITNVVFVKIVVIIVQHARLEDLNLTVNVPQGITKYVIKLRQTIVMNYVKIHRITAFIQ